MGARLRPDRLRFEMARRGLSGSDLARRARLSPGTVSQAINGRPVAAGTLAKIASALIKAEPMPGLDEMLDVSDGVGATRCGGARRVG